MKLIELLVAQPVLGELGKMRMGAKAAYAIAKNSRMMEADLQAVQAGREAIVKRLGTEVEGGKYEIAPEMREEAEREYRELIEQEAELKPHMVTLEQLEGLELTPAEMDAIKWMVSDY